MNKRNLAENPPIELIKGFEHTAQKLVYYKSNPEAGITDAFGIAYYHYNPPFDKPRWIDYDNYDRTPD